MCDPITIMLGIGTAAQAGGALFSGYAGSRAAKLQAQVARENTYILKQQAEIGRVNAEYALQKGAFQEARLRSQGEKIEGAQTAGFSARGLDPRYGSPLLVQGETAAQIEIDAGLIRSHAVIESAGELGKVAGIEAQAANSAWQAAAAMEKEWASRVAGWFGAGTALLNFAGKAKGGFSFGSGGGDFDFAFGGVGEQPY